jgi:hypothetical protein
MSATESSVGRAQADAAALVDEEPDEDDVEEDVADEDESEDEDEDEDAAASFGFDEPELVSDLPEPDLLSVR